VDESELLNLGVGDCIADSRLAACACSGKVAIQGNSVNIDVSRRAVPVCLPVSALFAPTPASGSVNYGFEPSI